MAQGIVVAAYYDIARENNALERTLECCRGIGADVDEEATERPLGEKQPNVPVSYDVIDDNLSFDLQSDRDYATPVVNTGVGNQIRPHDDSPEEYQRRMNAVLEFVCRLASCLEASYVPLLESEGDPGPVVVPDGRPIAEHVDTPPRFGIYSQEVLDGLGGVDGLFDHPYWYTAEVDDDRTLVIAVGREAPWMDTRFNDTTWTPPTDVDYLQTPRFNALPEEGGSDESIVWD